MGVPRTVPALLRTPRMGMEGCVRALPPRPRRPAPRWLCNPGQVPELRAELPSSQVCWEGLA